MTPIANQSLHYISANSAAVNNIPGTGALQSYLEKQLGIQNNHGIHLSGVISGDTNYLFTGGIPGAQRLTSNGLFLVSLSADTQELIGWKGGLFDVQFLRFDGQNTNVEAGSIQGYNGILGSPPLQRSELYQIWYKQEFFDNKFNIRIGKTVTSEDFSNVLRPVALSNAKLNVPATTALIYTPIFVNPAMLGVLPNYYNSAYGITMRLTPIKEWYASYGVYDGNMAQGKQTGLYGPTMNGSYFHIAETGAAWLLSSKRLPGNLGIGGWHQTGPITNYSLYERSAEGYYLFGTQRLWYRNPFNDNSGLSAFFQFGKNQSHVLSMPKYLGAGLTAYGLMPNRADDSMGLGSALAWLNQSLYSRRTELMFQGYYQAKLLKGIFLEPVLTYIPTPGANPTLHSVLAGSLRLIILY